MNVSLPACLDRDGYIVCGMYAFTADLKIAWRALFAQLRKQALVSGIAAGSLPERFDGNLKFDTDDGAYQAPAMLLGHTCGYPFIKKWRKTHQPVCVAEFDLPGTYGQMYSSWLICRRAHPARTLEEFAGGSAAINSMESNSGMNVLRHAVTAISSQPGFFSAIFESGSHVDSMRHVVSGSADMAAVDAVSFHHAVRSEPELGKGLRIFGQSVSTPGLPFIKHNSATVDRPKLTNALNRCLDDLGAEHRAVLRIKRFSDIYEADYRCIARLEAKSKGTMFQPSRI
ncbi:MAG: PhnD/SsuA/transferrin family substrate-binding protein [Gammaproteobacteria bacterium]|nr:PhnD/SsuA/transferrin family substrate-binding protein [Gammaproteobacteria bacterium]